MSRSQGRNLGRQYVKTPIAVSTESDILFPNNLIEECLKEFGNPPQKKYIQTYISLQDQNGIETKFEHCGGGPTANCGFFQVYRTEDFDNIGGYNPFLTGWGWEDHDFSRRIINYGCQHVVLPLFVTHMWHVPTYNLENHNSKNIIISNITYWDNNKKQWIKGEKIIDSSKKISHSNIGINCWDNCNKRRNYY